MLRVSMRNFSKLEKVVQKANKAESYNPLFTDLSLYNKNPFLEANKAPDYSLDLILNEMRTKEKKLLRHIPNHAPLRQAYFEPILSGRKSRSNRAEWIWAVGITLFITGTGLERFNLF